MRSIPSKLLCLVALLATCLATSACSERSYREKTIIQTISRQPQPREAVLVFYRGVADKLCSNKALMTEVGSTRRDCQRKVRQSNAACEKTTLATMPAIVSDFRTASRAGHGYVKVRNGVRFT